MDSISERTEAFLEALATVLKERREKMGLSRIELATRSGLTAPHIGYLESRKRHPSAESLKRIAIALETSVHELVAQAENT